MTERKPADVDFPGWVDRQIRQAAERGAFRDLPGAGKPIPDIDRRRHELDWLAGYLRRENVEVAGLLPPALALAKEVEDLPVRLLTERTEAGVRAIVAGLNRRIATAQAAPQDGPPVRVREVDVERVLADWAAARGRLAASAAERVAAAEAQRLRDVPRRRRSSWRRNRS